MNAKVFNFSAKGGVGGGGGGWWWGGGGGGGGGGGERGASLYRVNKIT